MARTAPSGADVRDIAASLSSIRAPAGPALLREFGRVPAPPRELRLKTAVDWAHKTLTRAEIGVVSGAVIGTRVRRNDVRGHASGTT